MHVKLRYIFYCTRNNNNNNIMQNDNYNNKKKKKKYIFFFMHDLDPYAEFSGRVISKSDICRIFMQLKMNQLTCDNLFFFLFFLISYPPSMIYLPRQVMSTHVRCHTEDSILH